MTPAIDTFKAAIVASRGNKPLSAIHRAALTSSLAGVNVDDVASFLDGFVGRDIRAYAHWMRDAHADRVALFATIRALDLSPSASPSVAADALEARLPNRETGRAARRGYGGEEPLRVIACRDREVRA